MIYLDKFLHFISADGHHYKVPSSPPSVYDSSSYPPLTVGGRPFACYNPNLNTPALKPLPLAYFSHVQGIPRVYNLSNVARSWRGHISITNNQGSVSVESIIDSAFVVDDTGASTESDPYFGYKVYIEFYDEHFRLKTTSDWIEWAYRDGNKLTHQLRTILVTLEGVAQYVKIRYNCFQSSDVTDSGPHVDYTSDYIRIHSGYTDITSASQTVSADRIRFIFSERIS